MNIKAQKESLASSASMTSLAKKKVAGIARRDSPYIPVEMLEVDPTWNVRGAGMLDTNEYWSQPHIVEYVSELATSYKEGLYVPPIVVEYNHDTQQAIVRDGQHRYHGLMQAIAEGADIARVEVSQSRGDVLEQNLLMLRSSNSLELNAVERAEIIYRLYSVAGYEPEELAKKINKSITYVQHMLRVHDLVPETKLLIITKKLSYAEAIDNDRKDKPFRAKSSTPPKKVVREVMDIFNEFKTSPIDADGNVNISIPAELLEKFLANLPVDEKEPQDSDNHDLFQSGTPEK